MYIVFLVQGVLLLLLTGVNCDRHLPKEFPRCFRDDPHIEECIIKATDTVRPLILGGVPALELPPLEPFKFNEINLSQGTDALNMKATLSNVLMHGLSNYKFSKFNIDMKTPQFLCELSIPALTMDGNYKLDGKILMVPLQGNGRFNASVAKVDATFFQKGKRVQKNGKTYVIPIYTNSTIHVTDPKISLDGLFGDNGDLSKLTTKAINDNISMLYEEIRPVLEKVISNFMQRTMAAVSTEISEDELYPPSPKNK